MKNKFRISFYMVKRIIRIIFTVTLAAWLIFLLIPRTNHYQYDCILNAEYEYVPMSEYFGGNVHVTADLHTKTIFNRIYVNGEVTIQNKKYTVSEQHFIPRSILAQFIDDWEHAGTMKPDYNSFSFCFDFSEPELKIYEMDMYITLTRNRISLNVRRIEDNSNSRARYAGRLN